MLKEFKIPIEKVLALLKDTQFVVESFGKTADGQVAPVHLKGDAGTFIEVPVNAAEFLGVMFPPDKKPRIKSASPGKTKRKRRTKAQMAAAKASTEDKEDH